MACAASPSQRKKEGGEEMSVRKCMGSKCWSEELTFVILFCACKWRSSWESKPTSGRESACVRHANAFVNMCHVSFLWLLKQLGNFQLWKFVKMDEINVYLV